MNAVVTLGIQAAKDLIVQYQSEAAAHTKRITEIRAEIIYLESVIDGTWRKIRDLERDIDAASKPKPEYVGFDHLRRVYESNGKLNAVKAIKESTGLSLMDAKRMIEAMAAGSGWVAPE